MNLIFKHKSSVTKLNGGNAAIVSCECLAAPLIAQAVCATTFRDSDAVSKIEQRVSRTR